MSTHRRVFLATVAVAAMAVGACGAAEHQPATPHELSLLNNTGAAAQPAIYPQPVVTYVLDGPLANPGSATAVRKLVSHDVTAADLARIGVALGMHGRALHTDTGWELRDGDAVLTVWTNGGATAVDYSSTGGAVAIPGSAGGGSTGSAGAATPGSSNQSTGVSAPPTISPITPPPAPAPTSVAAPVDVPSPSGAADIAQSLLNRLGVLSGQQWSHDVSDAGGVSVSCTAGVACTPTPTAVTARIVTYELIVAGVNVPDVSWSVTIGEHGRIESVSGAWAHPESAGTYPLRSAKKVFDDLRDGNARFVGPQPLPAIGAPGEGTTPGSPPATVVHITGVSLGMARWDGLENARPVVYLLPTYRFHAHVTGGSPYQVELLALDPGRFTFIAPPTPGGPSVGAVPPIAPTPMPGKGQETQPSIAS